MKRKRNIRRRINRKLETYHSLFQINRAFIAIARHCQILERAGFMPMVKMRILAGLIREMQSKISHDIVDKMHGIEDKDLYEFGKIRSEWEHYLNPDRPAFDDKSKSKF